MDQERLGIFVSPQQLSRVAQLKQAIKLRKKKEELERAQLMDAAVPDRKKKKKDKKTKKKNKSKKRESKSSYDVESMSTADLERYLKKRMKEDNAQDSEDEEDASTSSRSASDDDESSSEDEDTNLPRIRPTPKQVKSSATEPLRSDVDFFDWVEAATAQADMIGGRRFLEDEIGRAHV